VLFRSVQEAMMYNLFEDYRELLEDTEDTETDEAFESDEAVRTRPRPQLRTPVRTAPRGNPVPVKKPDGFATKADLQATAQKLASRIDTNSKAITSVDGKLRHVESETGKIHAMVRKEITERKAATEALKKSLDEQRQISMLLPLLATQETATVAGVNNVVIDSGDQLSKLLPILLLSGGLGGGSGSGSGPFGGDGGGIGTLALVLAMAK